MAADVTKPGQESPLRLRAEDFEDMAVIAACLQDAVVLRSDMTYLAKQRRFAMVMSRYCWEADPAIDRARRAGRPAAPGRGRRVRAGLHVDGVLKVDTLGFDQSGAEPALALLTIVTEPQDDGGAVLLFMFAGGAMLRLSVECVDCHVTDIGPSWDTPRQPRHPLGEAAAPRQERP
jgi:hypothetical protein